MKAFAIFLEKGYDGVSISDLQKGIGMGRASLYHYFKSKEDLFINAIDHCYLSVGKEKHLRDVSNLTLHKMLEMNIKQHKLAIEKQDALPGKRVGMLNYYLIAFQAMKYSPEFKTEALKLQQLELEQWKAVIKNSIAIGEIRQNIDIDETAKLFINAENGIGIRSTYSTTFEDIVLEVERMYNFLYSLIKS